MSSGHEQSTCVKERCGLKSSPLPLKVCSCLALTMDADHQVVLLEHQPLEPLAATEHGCQGST